VKIGKKIINETNVLKITQKEIKEIRNVKFVKFDIETDDVKDIIAFAKESPIDVFVISELLFHTRNVFRQDFWSKLFKQFSNSVFIFAEKRYLMGVFDPIEKITTIAEKTKYFNVYKHADGMSLAAVPNKDKIEGAEDEEEGTGVDESAD